MKRYQIEKILEADYGCEECPADGPHALVCLRAEDGEEKRMNVSEQRLAELGVDEGSFVTVGPDGTLRASADRKQRGKTMPNNFFATISRMKYIERWALMRNSRPENLSEHSAEVAMIAHALCVIGNIRYGKHLDAEKAALTGLYHDASEIITGDMPTPVKYYNDDLKTAYKGVESAAEKRLLRELPDDLRPVYEKIFSPDAEDLADRESAERENYMRRLVKAADKLSALIKCIEEENAGNSEFRTARASTQKTIDRLAAELPEVRDFVEEFLPPYGSTLDELL